MLQFDKFINVLPSIKLNQNEKKQVLKNGNLDFSSDLYNWKDTLLKYVESICIYCSKQYFIYLCPVQTQTVTLLQKLLIIKQMFFS